MHERGLSQILARTMTKPQHLPNPLAEMRSNLRPTVLEAHVGPAIVGRLVTTTITLVCVLIVYDAWGTLTLRDAILIVIGPILAIFLSHLFAASLVLQMELGRRPTGVEWFGRARYEMRLLLVGVPPVALLIVLDLAGVSIANGIRIVIWVEALSITFWAGLAARRAGFRGRSFAFAVLGGLLVSVIVLALQVVIQPGTAREGGTVVSDNHPLRVNGS